MPLNRPTAAEIATALEREHRERTLPTTIARSKSASVVPPDEVFRARIVGNLLGILRRELAEGEAFRSLESEACARLLGRTGADARALADAIEAGCFDSRLPELVQGLVPVAVHKLAIDSPGYPTRPVEGRSVPETPFGGGAPSAR